MICFYYTAFEYVLICFCICVDVCFDFRVDGENVRTERSLLRLLGVACIAPKAAVVVKKPR